MRKMYEFVMLMLEIIQKSLFAQPFKHQNNKIRFESEGLFIILLMYVWMYVMYIMYVVYIEQVYGR